MNNEYPKILIISNNTLSNEKNNGKTLISLFKKYPKDNIRQLYFNDEVPSSADINSYYQLTDKDLLSLSNNYGRIVKVNKNYKQINNSNITNKVPKQNFSRILREVLWSNERWNKPKLNNWLDTFQPEIIFFVAGDSGFAYNITKKIRDKYNTSLITFITDDYFLPRINDNLFGKYRRSYLKNKFKEIIQLTDKLITISPKMSQEYKRLFDIESSVLMNITDMKLLRNNTNYDKNRINFIYAGGLHYGRYDVLSKLGLSLNQYNERYKTKHFLSIYTNKKPNDFILKSINISNGSSYKGHLSELELKKELNDSDVLIHVESFDSKNIDSTRLSLSTKIMEYLSLEKPIIAIGPSNIASMEFLNDVAIVIDNPSNIFNKLVFILKDEDQLKEYSQKSAIKYKKSTMIYNNNKLLEIINDINN